MTTYIIHNEGWFFDYSTVASEPITSSLTMEEYKEYYSYNYKNQNPLELENRLKRAIKTGSSSYSNQTAQECINGNHAGLNGIELSLEDMIELTIRMREDFKDLDMKY